MKRPIGSAPNWLRFTTILLGIIAIFWLPIEDPNPRSSFVIATLICLLAAAHFHHRTNIDPCHRVWLRYPLTGLAIGLCAPILTAFLMLFKSGLHGHGFPEYIFQDYENILLLVPVTASLALLAGLGYSSWRSYQCRSSTRAY